MKNSTYAIDVVYQMLRNYYIKNFPYSTRPSVGSVINDELLRLSSSARIVTGSVTNTVTFENPHPAEPATDAGYNPAFILEECLSDQSSLTDLWDDLRAMREWLIIAGYLCKVGAGHTATETLLRTKTITE
jgi:hypothetical protein